MNMKQTAVYTELGWKAEVEVLRDDSDSSKYKYTLKVIKTLADGLLGRFPDGHIFTAFIDKNHMVYCDWRLTFNEIGGDND